MFVESPCSSARRPRGLDSRAFGFAAIMTIMMITTRSRGASG
jgi:hypothetical protein